MFVQKSRARNMKNSHRSIVALSKVDPYGKAQVEGGLLRYSLPPPPPPPIIGQRMANYFISAPKQRTAQQKIYEYKHRKSFGYY